MTGKPFTVAALACALAISAAYPALAGNGWNSSSRSFGHHHYHKAGPSVGYSSPVTHLRLIGTFSRSVWVMNPGNLRSRSPVLLPKATILHVGSPSAPYGFPDPCSYESGVCVIRMND